MISIKLTVTKKISYPKVGDFFILIVYLNSPGIPKTVAEATCPSE
jgi:hypothetical protein